MRNGLLVVLFITAGLLLIWWFVSHRPPAQPSAAVTLSSGGVKALLPPTSAAKRGLNTDISSTTQATPSAQLTPLTTYAGQVNGYFSAFLTPITFYGKVLDQFDAPVSGASIVCYAADKPLKSGSRYRRTTDSQGLFSVEGAVGISLGVEVSKPSYRVLPPSDTQVTSSGRFEYAVGTHRFSPDRKHPVVFRLYKPGLIEPLVHVGEKSIQIARDGSPLMIAVDEQGAHELVLRCWNHDLNRPEGQRTYDWRLEIGVPNGGLQARKDDFAFAAPTQGYVPGDTIDMPASLPYAKWDDSAERAYFIRFNDGTFARANLRMRAGGSHFVVWESFFNPKAGSPNLESSAESQSASR